jgi:tetratricopeptide (TPR) repeat protein
MKLNLSGKWIILFLVIICLFTALIYAGTLNYPLLSNDDADFFTKYPEILNLSEKSIAQYFSSYYVTLYQPLTVLTFALNYTFSGLSPLPLHLGNLIFHLLNIILVFIFFSKLLKSSIPALLIAFLFAVHPMNVETVVWISARSSSMYAFFYLLSLICYLDYIRSRKIPVLFMVFLFFILSLFCKVQAVTLPLILFVIDYFSDRRKVSILLLEKLPFLILSVIFLVIALRNTETSAFLSQSKLKSFSGFDLIFLNGRAVFFYLEKFLVPVDLSAVYAFPLKSGNSLPAGYYIYTCLVIILFFILFLFRKNKFVVLGAGIFLLSISINLPLISVRSIIFADRYAYFPYLGLLLITAVSLRSLLEKYDTVNRKYAFAFVLFILICGLFFSYLTLERTKKWENDMTLTTDVIQKNQPVPLMGKIYRKRGNYFAAHQMVPESIDDYSKAIELNPDDVDSYIYRAYAYLKLNRLKEALPDFDKALEFEPNNSVLYANRAMVKLNTGDKIGAGTDCNSCLFLDSTNAEAHNFLAILKFQSDDLPGAQQELRAAIRYNTQYAEAYKNLGVVLFKSDDLTQACYYWQIAARLGDRQARVFLRTNCLRK